MPQLSAVDHLALVNVSMPYYVLVGLYRANEGVSAGEDGS